MSSRYQLIDGEHLSRDELEAIGKQIEAGEPYTFKQIEIDALLEEKRLLEGGLRWLDKLKIALFLAALLVPLALGLFAIFSN